MHEMSITENLVSILLKHAERNKAARIISVTLRIGELSDVVPEAVQFCYDICTQGTIAAGSKLIIERPTPVAYCHNCQKEVCIHQFYDPCPECKDFDYDIRQGRELDIKSMEVE